jgi:putative DNA primase/helicase
MRKPNTTKSTEGFDTPSLLRPKRRKSIPLAEFMHENFPDEAPLLGKVITHGSTGMLSAQRGLGKSLLALHIGYSVAGGKNLEPWGRGIGDVVVYLDGEMHSRTLQKRLRQISNRDSKPASRKMVEQNFHIIGRDAFDHVIGYIDNEDDQAFIEIHAARRLPSGDRGQPFRMDEFCPRRRYSLCPDQTLVGPLAHQRHRGSAGASHRQERQQPARHQHP